MSSCPLAEQKCLEFWRGDDSCQDRPPLLSKRRCAGAGPWIGLGGKDFSLISPFTLKTQKFLLSVFSCPDIPSGFPAPIFVARSRINPERVRICPQGFAMK